MLKIKEISKSGRKQLMIKGQREHQLMERELWSINNDCVRGLLHMDVVRRGAAFKLFYDVTGFITFSQLLEAPLDKESFTRILDNIQNNMKAMEEAHFNTQMVLMDFDRVMVNPATQTIYFVYVPIQFYDNETTLRDFLLRIIRNCTFNPGEDQAYIKEYINILNSGVNFSLFDLEEYIDRLSGRAGRRKDGGQRCSKCQTVLPSGSKFCSNCGLQIGEQPRGGTSCEYDPLGSAYSKGRGATPAAGTDNSYTQGLSDGTKVLGQCGGTTVLGSGMQSKPQYPYLIRMSSGERIDVNSSMFRIGREQAYNDYAISDNPAVSGNHAQIICHGMRYYLIDVGSTNKSYVDRRMIQAEQQVEIFDGTMITFANEDFTFHT